MARAIPDYRSVPGSIVTMTFWEGMAAIRGFAGDVPRMTKSSGNPEAPRVGTRE